MKEKANNKWLVILPVTYFASATLVYLITLISGVTSMSKMHQPTSVVMILGYVVGFALILFSALCILGVLLIRKKRLDLLGWRDFVVMLLLSLVFPIVSLTFSLANVYMTNRFGMVFISNQAVANNIFRFIGVFSALVAILVYLLARTKANIAAIVLAIVYKTIVLLEMIVVFALAPYLILQFFHSHFSYIELLRTIRMLVFPYGFMGNIFILQALFMGFGMKKLPGTICGFCGLVISKFVGPLAKTITLIILISLSIGPRNLSIYMCGIDVGVDVVICCGLLITLIGMIISCVMARKEKKNEVA